jgi:hypothetical protein
MVNRVRQRTVWIVFICVVAASTALVDGLELRIYHGEASYWRSEWGELDGVRYDVASLALFLGPLVAGSLVAISLILAASRRLPGSRWRFAVYAAAVPLGLGTAFGVAVGIRTSPWLFWPDRTS